ncbi:hypothetical protein CP97_08920 [Aurantiacibacter atlanticus]|uniref:Uncharacterized protein n=1 Tax=Aurantiacibacter atlanticus TaxID=1648404 RepID=A0A0H4VG85_9SPHN|nr:hypothetical protein [Aurantiacibacter atlanticus]AKQ42114.2 hypothetical protein CP97_08920 [Aurantiacibacter atlanticus]MDF1834206.1 hypothetical protein [Alteraurantiacibacter sp. bin_em_oilr2.035]
MDMDSQLAANSIAFLALGLSALAAIYSWYSALETRRLERHVASRDDRVEKSTAYLELEVHSSEAFRFAAANAIAMRPYESTDRPARLPKNDRQNAATTLQHYYQCLNLFEVCSNFRRNGVVDAHVFASWVAWFHEVLDQWYFREMWEAGMRENYTPDVRHIFDIGIRIYESHPDADIRRREFYVATSHLLGGCPIIENWLDDIAQTPQWPPVDYGFVTMIPLNPADGRE